MEEEVGIKVTRLRRRLSVEADEVKSPSTQSTPTKKRGGRLAAKPQLELIDENAPEAAPKRTRKSTVKDVAEPVEESAVTPSRRSTRIRSNTSIVSETPGDVAEEKATPSRRTTRIKSNTSLIAEPVNMNSPRAKRAARRTSQVGSDNETPITPARTTRRTRNNSTSSIDKPVESSAGKLGDEIKEVIMEESENNANDTKTTDISKKDSPSLRKSPRLVGKPGRKSSSLLDNDNKENEPRVDKEASETPAAADKSQSEPKSDTAESADQKASKHINLSVTSKNLIQEIEEIPKKVKTIFNKSAPTVEEPRIQTKRNRTKSWTTISVETPQESSFCSDSETTKKRKKKKNDTLNFSNTSGSGDGIMNVSSKNNETEKEQNNISLNSPMLSNKKKKKQHELAMTVETETSIHEVSVLSTSADKAREKLTEAKDSTEDAKEEGNTLNSSKKLDTSATQKLFEQAPSGVVQSFVFMDDSDSNQEKVINDKKFDSEDQCVPVVDHQFVGSENKNPQSNLSYEPMDIDETMPENVSITNSMDENCSMSDKRKSMNVSEVKNDSINKSKRMSGTSDSAVSPRKSIITDMINDLESNKSKRKLSITNEVETTTGGNFNVSSCKSTVDDTDNHDEINSIKANKSNRKSSISNVTEQKENYNNSKKKSLTANNQSFDEIMNTSYKSNRKSSLSNEILDENTNETSNKSTRKFSVSALDNDENVGNSLNKSKRKSVSTMAVEVSMDKTNTTILADDENMKNKSSNKSKRKSSILNMNNVSTNEVHVDKDLNEQLSKSVNVPNVNTANDTDKKNLSLTYSTSTPLQPKSVKKLGLHLNTSVIAPNSTNKIEKNDSVNKSKKEAYIMSEEEDSDSSEEEGSDSSEEEDVEEESSLEKSKLMDDEAEEDSDNYESGDSRDEEEKQYEKENEIREKGETIDSDEAEFSNDSDYEKDSFIVSSDEEDNDLLSGTGEDLSLSADELTMSAKSKKKFNERKIKEQKKASREMYEARHNLNESDNSKRSSKSKKNHRQRFDTSSSESDKEFTAHTKKNRRQRIDSSHEESVSKKHKAKRLSESLCVEDEINEKEITILDENQADKTDPLILPNIIKKEPKTPQKELNISTVAINNMDKVEEVNVDENVSIMKANQTSDPLQATIAENEDEDITEEGSISENEEITENYESVLSNLNKSGSKKIKSSSISLDLNKKKKQTKEPIVYQLNLTQVKKSMKNKVNATEDAAKTDKQDKSLNKSKEKVGKQDYMSEGSSDSIDMKLLFNEDSNDSEMVIGKKKQAGKEIAQKEDDEESPGDFIPLKRSLGKTNFHESMGTTEDDKLGFFIDTSGTLVDENKFEANTSIKNSAKKNKQKNSISFADRADNPLDDDSNDAPLEVSYRSKKNKSKQDLNTTQNTERTQDISASVESPNHSTKNKKGLNSSQNVAEFTKIVISEKSNNISVTKKKKRLLGTEMALEQDNETTAEPVILNVSSGSAKKQKHKTISESTTVDTEVVNTENGEVMNQDLVAKKRKRKSSANQTIDEIIIKDDSNDAPLEVSHHSKKNESTQDLNTTRNNEGTQNGIANVESPNQNAKNKKKNKKGLNSSQNVAEFTEIVTSDYIPEKSNNISVTKKKKKGLSESQMETDNETTAEPVILNVSLGCTKKQKQKTISESTTVDRVAVNKENEEVMNQELVTKKRKRKSSANQTIDEIIIKDNVKPNDESMTTKNKKKKRKISNNNQDFEPQLEDAVTETQEQQQKTSKVHNQKGNKIDEGATKKNKKRKDREDDDASKVSKILKQNSFDKVYVPRLPSNILKQLDDKPNTDVVKAKKTKVVSTSEFVVAETKRKRTKPSNYLEQSVCCINDDVDDKKHKLSIKIPKVLPFIPTASTSDSGFTTNFRVNIISQETKFVAQSSDLPNFKNDYLLKKRIKKLGTFETYKRQRNIKIAKF